jgi:hypothetical protein
MPTRGFGSPAAEAFSDGIDFRREGDARPVRRPARRQYQMIQETWDRPRAGRPDPRPCPGADDPGSDRGSSSAWSALTSRAISVPSQVRRDRDSALRSPARPWLTVYPAMTQGVLSIIWIAGARRQLPGEALAVRWRGLARDGILSPSLLPSAGTVCCGGPTPPETEGDIAHCGEGLSSPWVIRGGALAAGGWPADAEHRGDRRRPRLRTQYTPFFRLALGSAERGHREGWPRSAGAEPSETEDRFSRPSSTGRGRAPAGKLGADKPSPRLLTIIQLARWR